MDLGMVAMKSLKSYLPYIIGAFVVAFALYLKTVRYEFVSIDDADYVVCNPRMERGLTLDNIKWAFCNPDYASNWHPIAWISLMCDVTIMRTVGTMPEKWEAYENCTSHCMHLHNVIIHALNTALLLVMMYVMISRLGFAQIAPIWPLIIALLWSLHPLRTEVVCWVAERKELISVLFMVLSLISYACRSGRSNAVVAFVFAALAMMAKPVAVTLPVVLFAWDWVIFYEIVK